MAGNRGLASVLGWRKAEVRWVRADYQTCSKGLSEIFVFTLKNVEAISRGNKEVVLL